MAFNFSSFGQQPAAAAQAPTGFGFTAQTPAPQPGGFSFGMPAPAQAAPQAAAGFGGFSLAPQQPQQQPQQAGGFGGGFQAGGFGVTPVRPAVVGGFGGFQVAQPQQQPQQQQGGWGLPQQQPQQAAPVAGGPEPPDFRLEVPNIATSTDPSFSSLDFSPTSQFIVSGAWDNKGRVWELSRDGSGRYGPGSTGMRAEVDMGGPLLDVKWSQWEATKVYAVGCNKMLRTWDLNTNQLADLGQHSEPISCVHLALMGGSTPVAITAGWDRSMCFWDARAPAAALSTVALPERVFCMDVRGNDMVVCTAPEAQGGGGFGSRVHIFDLRNHAAPVRSVVSPLKYQSRAVRIFGDGLLYALGSIEGRCKINALRASEDEAKQVGDPQQRPLCFAFRCHRDARLVYPVNAIDCFPSADPQRTPVFATAGSDGVVTLWNRRERQKIKDMAVEPTAPPLQGPEGIPVKQRQPITDVRFSGDGALLACAASYDWSRGPDSFDRAAQPYIYVKNLTPEYLTVKK